MDFNHRSRVPLGWQEGKYLDDVESLRYFDRERNDCIATYRGDLNGLFRDMSSVVNRLRCLVALGDAMDLISSDYRTNWAMFMNNLPDFFRVALEEIEDNAPWSIREDDRNLPPRSRVTNRILNLEFTLSVYDESSRVLMTQA